MGARFANVFWRGSFCCLLGPFTQTDVSAMFGRAIPVALLLVRYVYFFDFVLESFFFVFFFVFFLCLLLFLEILSCRGLEYLKHRPG